LECCAYLADYAGNPHVFWYPDDLQVQELSTILHLSPYSCD